MTINIVNPLWRTNFNKFVFCFIAVYVNTNYTSIAEVSDDIDTKLKDTQFVIEKELTISLPEEQQIFGNIPLEEDNTQSKPRLKYNFHDIDVDLGLISKDTKMLKAKEELLEKLYLCYLKLGHSTSPSPLLEFGYANTYDPVYSYGAYVKHNSHGNGIEAWDYFYDYNNNVRLYGGKYINELLITAEVEYGYDKFTFYNPTPPQLTNSAHSKPRQMAHIDLAACIKNYNPSNLRYRVDLGYYNTSIEYNFSEHQVFSKSNIAYSLSDTRQISATTKIFISKYENEEKEINRNTFETRITDKFDWRNFDITYGIALNIDNEKRVDPMPLTYFMPLGMVQYTYNKWIKPFLMPLDGYVTIQSLRSMINENPYICPNAEIYNEIVRQTKIGITGNDETTSYKFVFGVIYLISTPYYINAYENMSQFYVKTHRKDICLNTEIELQHSSLNDVYQTKLLLAIKNSMFLGNTNPIFILSCLTTYKLYEKWLLKSNCYFMTGHKYIENGLTKEEIFYDTSLSEIKKTHIKPSNMKALIDISLGVDYLYNSRLTIFGVINNLLNRANLRYHNTKPDTIRLTAGITYSFL